MLDGLARSISSGALLALVLTASGTRSPLDASARSAGQGQAGTQEQSLEVVTIIGCVIRDLDYARATGGGPASGNAASPEQLVLTAPNGLAPAYSVTGLRETELARHIGSRVEIVGTAEPVRVADQAEATRGDGRGGRIAGGIPPSGANGVTPDGSPSHEPGDAISGTAPATATATVARVVDAPVAVGTSLSALPRIRVTSFRAVDGPCADLRTGQPAAASSPSSGDPAASPGRLPAAEPPRAQPITVIGCLVRQTPAGAALTPQPTGGDTLVLTGATGPADRTPNPGASAVPGSAPSGSGSGTLPASASPVQRAAPVEERSLVIATRDAADLASLAKYVGQRVELAGTIEEPAPVGSPAPGAARASSSAAHTSAPVQRITMTGFRSVGGSCQ